MHSNACTKFSFYWRIVNICTRVCADFDNKIKKNKKATTVRAPNKQFPNTFSTWRRRYDCAERDNIFARRLGNTVALVLLLLAQHACRCDDTQDQQQAASAGADANDSVARQAVAVTVNNVDVCRRRVLVTRTRPLLVRRRRHLFGIRLCWHAAVGATCDVVRLCCCRCRTMHVCATVTTMSTNDNKHKNKQTTTNKKKTNKPRFRIARLRLKKLSKENKKHHHADMTTKNCISIISPLHTWCRCLLDLAWRCALLFASHRHTIFFFKKNI